MDGLNLGENEHAAALALRYGQLWGEALLGPMIRSEFRGRIALVSSFGAEAAVLLHMVAAIAPATPVLFLDTGKHFGETLRYRDALVARLGLKDVRSLAPDAAMLAISDADGMLWRRDPDACCAARKVAPLAAALKPFAAWITGRKRHHGGTRRALPVIEAAGGRIKINPLASRSAADIAAEFAARDLPPHPLVADGFRSIGCMPCTARIAAAAEPRSGRWPGLARTECGIHLECAAGRPEP
jgi:phosphoadenosine phosphosulfate reductase